MSEEVHLEEVIDIHFSAGVAASVDFVELLRERRGGIRGQEYATEHSVRQGVIALELGIHLLKML